MGLAIKIQEHIQSVLNSCQENNHCFHEDSQKKSLLSSTGDQKNLLFPPHASLIIDIQIMPR